ncbi:Uncharacterised protein [uncultured archaeon]|nr:Uncharacterised protein [uncultured archaeon]
MTGELLKEIIITHSGRELNLLSRLKKNHDYIIKNNGFSVQRKIKDPEVLNICLLGDTDLNPLTSQQEESLVSIVSGAFLKEYNRSHSKLRKLPTLKLNLGSKVSKGDLLKRIRTFYRESKPYSL